MFALRQAQGEEDVRVSLILSRSKDEADRCFNDPQ